MVGDSGADVALGGTVAEAVSLGDGVGVSAVGAVSVDVASGMDAVPVVVAVSCAVGVDCGGQPSSAAATARIRSSMSTEPLPLASIAGQAEMGCEPSATFTP